jgi:hypothetical protein
LGKGLGDESLGMRGSLSGRVDTGRELGVGSASAVDQRDGQLPQYRRRINRLKSKITLERLRS